MRTASPWWLSLILGVGLLFTFVGERLFAHDTGFRGVFTLLGVVLIVGTTLVRAWTWFGSTGSRKKVERVLLLAHVATIAALVLYALTTNWGLSKLALAEQTSARFAGAATVLFTVLLVVSLIPVAMIELSLGLAMRDGFDMEGRGDDAGVELHRVREVGWSGLTIALAMSLLFVTCSVANERNVQRDVSYFKTSSPGESTQNIVRATPDPIKVLLFFPDVNEVKDQVKSYFAALSSATNGKVLIEEHDLFRDAEIAGKYKVKKDGTVVLVRGKDATEKSQSIDVGTELEKARKGTGKLRNLDREVNTLLLKIVRDKRKAYVVVGHGEMNDPDSVPPDLRGRVPERRTTVFKRRLGDTNYEIKDLGLMDLASNVPDDATLVILLAPSAPLMDAEWESLDRYLQRGGRLLVALDPKSVPSLGKLEQRLGWRFNPADLTDDKMYMPQRGTPADRRFAMTNKFSSHASTTGLSRSGDKNGLILIDSGALEEIPNVAAGGNKTVTIRSLESSFLDLNNNFEFDAGAGEKRQSWNISVAIEGPKTKDQAGKEKDGFRVLLFADADLFTDVAYMNQLGQRAITMISRELLEDSVKWLGGEETYVGEVVSEDDKPIKHTKDQEAKWFTLTIIAGPILVLTLGLVGTWARKRRSSKKKSEVTP